MPILTRSRTTAIEPGNSPVGSDRFVMEAFWFCIVTLTLATYAILDGFDLGVGAMFLFLARTEQDRRKVLDCIGPFWNGNQIWLLLAGGAVYFAFPHLYSSRTFCTWAIALCWIIMLRAVSLELLHRADHSRSRHILQLVFGVSSMLVVTALGVAVGYLIQEVPSSPAAPPFAWFPVLCGAFALAVLTLYSALWLSLRLTGELQTRCRRMAGGLWWVALLCYAGVTVVSFGIQPHIVDNLMTNAWVAACAVFALAGLTGARLCLDVHFDLGAFASVCCLLIGSLISAAAGQFPYLVDSNPAITVYTAASARSLAAASPLWCLPILLVAIAYNASLHFGASARARRLSSLVLRSDSSNSVL